MTTAKERTDTVSLWLDSFVQLDALRDRASDLVTSVIRDKLVELEAEYPRHKFGFVDGMGATFFTVSPAFRGEKHLTPSWFDSDSIPDAGREIFDRLTDSLNDILEISERFSENFNMDVGDIPSPSAE